VLSRSGTVYTIPFVDVTLVLVWCVLSRSGTVYAATSTY